MDRGRAAGQAQGRDRPLFGKRVLVTRARDQAGSAAELLAEEGAQAVVVSTIELAPPRDPEAVRAAVARLGSYDWVVFTSANGVERTWDAILAGGLDARAFRASRLAAIGPATADALRVRGLVAEVTAKELRGEGLADAMIAAMERAKATASPASSAPKVLLLRAQDGREVLPEALRRAGCHVDVIAVYETRPVAGVGDVLRRAFDAGLDAVTFTSGSTVDHLCDALGADAVRLLSAVRVVSIGPITTQAAVARGVRVDATADPATLEGLVRALSRALGDGLRDSPPDAGDGAPPTGA